MNGYYSFGCCSIDLYTHGKKYWQLEGIDKDSNSETKIFYYSPLKVLDQFNWREFQDCIQVVKKVLPFAVIHMWESGFYWEHAKET